MNIEFVDEEASINIPQANTSPILIIDSDSNVTISNSDCGQQILPIELIDNPVSSCGTIVHNKLLGLQGGDPTNRYHIDKTQWQAITGAHTPNAGNPFATLNDITGAAVTASNGLTKVGGDIRLGGLINQPGINAIQVGPTSILAITSLASLTELPPDGTKAGIVLWLQNGVTYGGAQIIGGVSHSAQISLTGNLLDSPTQITMDILDTLNNLGLKNGGDYEANFLPRSLVTKQYVDGLISGVTTTASNGLTKTTNDIKLGGTITEDTNVISFSPGIGFSRLDSSTAPTVSSFMGVDSTGAGIAASRISTGEIYRMAANLGSGLVAMQYTNTTGSLKSSSLTIGNNGMVVLDENFTKGLTYKIDYSTNGILDDRWIPDYGAVKALIPGSITASNGLARVGNDIQIGSTDGATGGLTRTTILNTNSNLLITGNPTGLGALTYIGPHSFGFNNFENNVVTQIISDNGSTGHPGILIGAGNATSDGSVINTQSITITANSMVVTDESKSFGLEYVADYSVAGIVNPRWIPDYGAITALDVNNVKLTGHNNQTIQGTISVNPFGSAYTTVLGDRGIRNSDYEITTNGANAFFNVNIRNGLGIVGMSGDSIASFNDQNGTADNPNIRFFFPLLGTTASFSSAPVNPTDVVRLQDIIGLNSSYSSATTGVSSINVFGTSYEGNGFGSSNPSTLSWIPLMKPSTGWVINNQGVSGNFICDQTFQIYNTIVFPRTFTIADLGVNDMNFYYTDATKQAIFADEHLAVMAYMAIPNSKKILANSSAVTYVGTWTNGKYAISKQTSGSGNTATMTITGTTVIVSTTQGDGLTGGFTIKIDGSTVYTGTNGTGASMVTNNGSGINFGPSIKMFTGLSNTPHTVVITTTNANAVYFDWAAGIDTSTPNPTVYAFNLVYQNATGNPYPINNPNVDTYNGFITSNISTLSGLGLNIGLIDVNSVINPATDIGAFGIHPNDAGYAKIATKVLATIPSTFYNVGSPIQTLSSANNSASWLVLKNTNPAITSGIGIQFQNDDASNASIFRAPSTATDRTPFALYISNNSTSNNTVLTNDIIFNNGAVEALRLLSGNVRLPQFKTAGVVTNTSNGQLVSSTALGSTLGGSGVSNAGNLTWGSGGTLGSMAFISTASPTFTGTMTVPTGSFSGTQVGMFTAWPVNTLALFGASASGGASYPFTGNNNALIAARPAFDIVFGTGNPTVVRGFISALSGNFNWGSTSGTDVGALLSVTQPTTGNGTAGNTASGTTVTGVGTQFTNTFKVGDIITMSGETQTVTAIASNTSMTTTAWTNAHTASTYTLVGGTRFQVFGNGNTTVNTLNKVTITAPATNATLTLAQGSTLATVGAFSIILTATGATSLTLPSSGTLYGTSASSISSAQLLSSLSDETGTGSVVFSVSPTFTGTPLAPTAVVGTNTTQIATTAFVAAGFLSTSTGRVGQATLVAGTVTITVTGVTTSSRAFVQLVTPSGTTLTITHQAVCTANTLTIQANVAAGTINAADTSVLNYLIIN